MKKVAIPPKKPEAWLIYALQVRIAEQKGKELITLPVGLALHLDRALHEAAGLEVEPDEDFWLLVD